jgi:hypothetical protein
MLGDAFRSAARHAGLRGDEQRVSQRHWGTYNPCRILGSEAPAQPLTGAMWLRGYAAVVRWTLLGPLRSADPRCCTSGGSRGLSGATPPLRPPISGLVVSRDRSSAQFPAGCGARRPEPHELQADHGSDLGRAMPPLPSAALRLARRGHRRLPGAAGARRHRGSFVPTGLGASSPPSAPLDPDDLAELASFGAPGLGLCATPAASRPRPAAAASAGCSARAHASARHGHPVVDVGALLTPRATLKKFAGARFKREAALAAMRAALLDGGPGYFYAANAQSVLSSDYIASVYDFARELHCA